MCYIIQTSVLERPVRWRTPSG